MGYRFCPFWRRLAQMLALALAAGLFGVSASNATVPVFAAGTICHISGSESLNYAAVAGDRAKWNCSAEYPEWRTPREIVRHDLRGLPDIPRYLSFTRNPFEKLEIALVAPDGSQTVATYREQDIAAGYGLTGFIALPATEKAADALIITIDGSSYPENFVAAQITAAAPINHTAGWAHLLAAMLCGLLLAPLFFDLGFLRTLREPFPLFHALFCLTATIQTAAVTGLIPLLTAIPLEVEGTIDMLSFDLMLVALVLFVRSFLERAVLDNWHRELLLVAAMMPLAANILGSVGYAVLGDAAVYHLMMTLYSALIAAVVFIYFVAWRRGSRAVYFVALGVLPLLVIGTLRVIGALVPALFIDFREMWAQSFALLFEVVVTSFAVADRFLAIKRERDHAIIEARSLEAISEHDPLTGLLNRRALEARFEKLRDQGFTALAVVDLDHFKPINDTFGHQLGDEALVCAARALRGDDDPDLLAFRIGGEEFLMLLRGRAKQSRAEVRRMAISTAIASKLTIDRKVTASMGYIEATAGAIASVSFESLYERADRLLYEAKERGRDMTVAEKVRVFQRREEDRRSARVAA